MNTNDGRARNAVLRLAAEDPQWIPAVRAAVSLARSDGQFAGAWILAELRRGQAPRTWYPNFRPLVTFGILEKAASSTRGGRRDYYRMPDPDGVTRGLEELDNNHASRLHSPFKLSFAGIGRSGRADVAERAEEILAADFPGR